MTEQQNPQAQLGYVDLEIRIRSLQADGYPVEFTLAGYQEFPKGYLRAQMLPWVTTLSPATDGERLFNWLLEDDRLKSAWAEARGQHPHRRIRLRIDADAPELHAIPWELLRDTSPSLPAETLAADADTPFSRYLALPMRPRPLLVGRPVKLLVAIANPHDLSQYGLTPIDEEKERQIIQAAIGAVSAAELIAEFLPPPITLASLETALLKGYHFLHLVAHGHYDSQSSQAVVFLANSSNHVAFVTDSELAEVVERHGEQLRLVFMASCQSATMSPADAFRGIAPKLVAGGVPAVVAMQDSVSMEAAREFAQVFYRQLLQHGLVDRASNEARSALIAARRPSEWGIPVLYSRMPEGAILGAPEPRWQRLRTKPAIARILAFGGALLGIVSVVGLLLGLFGDVTSARQPGGPLYAVWPVPTATAAAMPADFFNVAVAEFAERDPDGRLTATETSQELSTWLFEAIKDEINRFQDLSANYMGPDLVGGVNRRDAQWRAVDAQAVAKRLNATVLIYGTIEKHADGYYAYPEFYINEEGFNFGRELLAPDRLGHPVRFALPLFEDTAESNQINGDLKARRRALQHIVAGLVYYYLNDPLNAAAKFDQAILVEGWSPDQGKEVAFVLKGAALLRAYQANDSPVARAEALSQASRAFTTALEINPNYLRPTLGLGALALAQAQLSKPVDREKLLEASGWYSMTVRRLANKNEEEPLDEQQPELLMARADYGLGQVTLLGAEAGYWSADKVRGYFAQVIDTFQASQAGDRLWFLGHTHGQLGRLARMEGDPQGMVNEFRQAVDLLSQMPSKPPLDWIAVYWAEIGDAEGALGHGEEARAAYRQALLAAEQAGSGPKAFTPVQVSQWQQRLSGVR